MKTKKRPIAKKIKVQAYPKAIVLKPAVCGICGAVANAKWNDDKTGREWLFCTSIRCRNAAWKLLPPHVQDRFTRKDRPRSSSMFLGPNEIELVIYMPGKSNSVVKGPSARYCYGAWLNSIDKTDFEQIGQLYRIAPASRFLIFNEDGCLRGIAKKRKMAETLAGKDKVIVWWGGR